MINYGDAIDWMLRNNAVMRFVERRVRSEFVITNESIPGNKSLEMAVTVDSKNYVCHCALDSSKEPSAAIAVAIISCVQFFVKKFEQRPTAHPANSELRRGLYGSIN